MQNHSTQTSPTRAAQNAAILEMFDCPVGGYRYTTVTTVAIFDQGLIASAMRAAVEDGRSYVLVHVPVDWDVSLPLMACAVTAVDVGVQVNLDLNVWLPVNEGPALLVNGEDTFAVGEDGAARVILPLGPERSLQSGCARAVMRLMRATTCAPGVRFVA